MASVKKDDSASRSDDDFLAGRGPPAFMSIKEPAIRMLVDRYCESFAVTEGIREKQVHLFLIKLGMWALVWTFTPKDVEGIKLEDRKNFGMNHVLKTIESAIVGENQELQKKLDVGVARALERMKAKMNDTKYVR